VATDVDSGMYLSQCISQIHKLINLHVAEKEACEDDVIRPRWIDLIQSPERMNQMSEVEMNSDQKFEMNIMLCCKNWTLLFLLKVRKWKQIKIMHQFVYHNTIISNASICIKRAVHPAMNNWNLLFWKNDYSEMIRIPQLHFLFFALKCCIIVYAQEF
jgi:hypothetical protein